MTANVNEVLAQARAVWPGITVAPDRIAAAMAVRDADSVRPDVVLALACLDGDPTAIALFELHLLAPVAQRIARSTLGGVVADEVVSRLRASLFVGSEDRPARLATYSGGGELRGWLTVVATREAYKVARRQPGERADEHILASLPDDDDLELRSMKLQHRGELGRAFTDSLATLPARERLVLRQRYLDQLTLDEIGALHGVHRITVMRWLARVEKTLLRAIRRSLTARLKLAESEITRLVDDARSGLDVSLRTLLSSRGDVP